MTRNSALRVAPFSVRRLADYSHEDLTKTLTDAAGLDFAICPPDEFYLIGAADEAPRRVLFDNSTLGADRRDSIVGPSGHLERANAWTHVVAAVAFVAYAIARNSAFDTDSTTGLLSGISIVVSAVMFLVSALYHIFGTVARFAATMRNVDHAAIYFAIGASSLADASLSSDGFSSPSTQWQTVADPVLASLVLIVYFSTRRFMIPSSETKENIYASSSSCALGLFRVRHSDLEHSSLRVAGAGALLSGWVLLAPSALSVLPPHVAPVWLVGTTFATLLMVFGTGFDGAETIDSAYAENRSQNCACASTRLGCVMTSHAWWHILSFVSVSVLVFARDLSL